ncbi:MAG: hypothetical protein GY903_03715 [Fuerstiella sp.]|nr:hypothetical protein [Fuerstiella sp.]MCP4853582.1 hypothetical protein [Fuerstiella sp.]
MRSLTPVTVFVVAILIFHNRGYAQLNSVTPEDTATVSSTATSQYYGVNGFDQYRQYPGPGTPGSAGYGFKHFPSPMPTYTTWYRPKTTTLTRCVRCAPDVFRPRGFGNLFTRPCDPFRMEYNAYTLKNEPSKYGPAYMVRQPDQRCEDCKH